MQKKSTRHIKVFFVLKDNYSLILFIIRKKSGIVQLFLLNYIITNIHTFLNTKKLKSFDSYGSEHRCFSFRTSGLFKKNWGTERTSLSDVHRKSGDEKG
jgi:hypothetical protein